MGLSDFVARMQRSGIRVSRGIEHPGFRCAASGLRWPSDFSVQGARLASNKQGML